MKSYLLVFALVLCSFAGANEEKPKLNLCIYEQPTSDEVAEVLFMTEFDCEAPSVQPLARTLGIAELWQQAATLQGKSLADFCENTRQPQNLVDHIAFLDKTVKVRFFLPADLFADNLDTLLSIVNSIPAEVGNISSSLHEETKEQFAIAHATMEKSRWSVKSEQLNQQLFDMLPVATLNQFMKEHFPKAKCHLIIAYPKNNAASKQLIESKAEALKSHWNVQAQVTPKIKSALQAKTVEIRSDVAVVDGKIYMDPPGRYGTKENGENLGWAFLIAGIVMGIFSFGISFLAFGIAGVVLLCQTYLTDPAVIERMRAEVLSNGYYYAHTQQSVGLTLTPFERRQLFIRDIFEKNHRPVFILSDMPGYYALNTYSYDAPEMKQFLYADEVVQLKAFQANYCHDLKNIGRGIKSLKADVALLTQPYRDLRDTSVMLAHHEFHSDSAVVQRDHLLENYENTKKQILSDYDNGSISYDEKQIKLAKADSDLDESMKGLEEALSAAEARIHAHLTEAKAAYDTNVASSNFFTHASQMKGLIDEEWQVNAHHCEAVSQYIMNNMNTRENSFPDFLDLRARAKKSITSFSSLDEQGSASSVSTQD